MGQHLVIFGVNQKSAFNKKQQRSGMSGWANQGPSCSWEP